MSSKLQRYMTAKSDPAFAMMQYMEGTDERINKKVDEAINQAVKEAEKDFQKKVAESENDFRKKVTQFLASIPEMKRMAHEQMKEHLLEMKEHLLATHIEIKGERGMPGEKGDAYILTPKDKAEIARKIDVPIVVKQIEKVVKELPIIKEVAKSDEPEEIVKKINSLPLSPDKQIGVEHIKGILSMFENYQHKGSEKRVGGGGGNASSSASLSVLTATGDIDDTNTTFTFASEPTLVVVNGAMYQNGSGVTITGTTAELDNPAGVGGSVYGIA